MLVRALVVALLAVLGGTAWLALRPAVKPPAPAAGPVPVSAGSVRRGAVPAPQRQVLRVSGVTGGNAGATTRFDLATLERLPQVRVTLDEPFRNRRMTFTGPLVEDVLDVAGAPADATLSRWHALDDYRLRLGVPDLVRDRAVLATREGGRPIAVAEGGPIRVVFPDGVPLGRNDDNWIWSVDAVHVRR